MTSDVRASNPWWARWLGAAAAIIAIAGNIAFATLEDRGRENVVGDALLLIAFTLFPIAGAVIASRQARNPIGWIYCAIGVLVGVGGTAQAYAADADPARGLGMLEMAAGWFAQWWWYPLLGLIMIGVVYLFPTGRLPSRWWRLAFWPGVIAISLITFAAMTTPRVVVTADGNDDAILYEFTNPIAIGGLGDPEDGPIAGPAFGVMLVSVLLGAVSTIVRFVRSRGVERQQMKWFAMAVLLIPISILLDEVAGISDIPFGLALCALPISTAIAVLRYRLYEIDVVINRALVYGTLTAVLGAMYVGFVFALQSMLASVTARNDFVIAASTLAVAAVFRPARSRVQRFIDHRFYRRKFNAVQTVERFSAHLRDEVELAAVREQLVEVVRETMQPSHVSLWLRNSSEATSA